MAATAGPCGAFSFCPSFILWLERSKRKIRAVTVSRYRTRYAKAHPVEQEGRERTTLLIQRSLFFDSIRREEWVQTLITKYHYPSSHISSFLNQYLAIYRDPLHRIPFILVADAFPSGADPSNELLNLARSAGFELVVIGDPADHIVYQLGSYGEYRKLNAIPTWMPSYPRHSFVPRTVTLLPFRTEDEVRKCFTKCHDAIYKALAQDPAATFDFLMHVIATKIWDEQFNPSPVYQFSLVTGEPDIVARHRLIELMLKASKWMGFSFGAWNTLERDLPPHLAQLIFSTLQDYSLTLSADSASGTDILGNAYEAIVGSTFRGELGAYFTPRNIADFMARFLNIHEGNVFDPACGTGGLLLAVHRYAKTINGHQPRLRLFGNDINRRMVATARVNFLLHGLPPDHIVHGDGLQLDRVIQKFFPDFNLPHHGTWLTSLREGPFDAVLANPPFAGHERDEQNLARIETAHRSDGTLRSLNRTIPFLEVILASLKNGGVAGVVIPVSILNAEEESFEQFRSVLLRNAEILAIIGLPEWAFTHTDCGIHGCLLFFRRRSRPRSNYDIFVDWADNIGYDRLGRPTSESDFERILETYMARSWPTRNRVRLSDLLAYNRFDPTWLRVVRTLPAFYSTDREHYVPLTEIVRPRRARILRRHLQDEQRYKYFEVSDADPVTGEVMQVRESTGYELRKKGRIRIMVRDGDILLPNHKDSLTAKAGPAGRSVVRIDRRLDGVLTTDRFMVLRPLIDARLATAILNAPEVRRQIVAHARGAASLDIREDVLEKVLVPRSLLEEHAAKLLELLAEIDALRFELARKLNAVNSLINRSFADA